MRISITETIARLLQPPWRGAFSIKKFSNGRRIVKFAPDQVPPIPFTNAGEPLERVHVALIGDWFVKVLGVRPQYLKEAINRAALQGAT